MSEPPSFDMAENASEESKEDSEMCQVTTEVEDDNSELINGFADKAKQIGYSDDVVKEVLSKDTSNVKSFSDFEKLLDKIVDSSEAELLSSADKKRIRKSYSKNITKFTGSKNPIEYLQDCISGRYRVHPMCVTVLDILEKLKDDRYTKVAKLDIFETPYEALCAQWDSDWVGDAVSEIQKSWEGNETILGYISTYLKDNDIEDGEAFWKEAESLAPTSDLDYNNLPVFKRYLLTQRHLLSKGEPVAETDSKDLLKVNSKGTVSCDSKLLDYMNGGVPSAIASMLRLNEAVAKKEQETGEVAINKTKSGDTEEPIETPKQKESEKSVQEQVQQQPMPQQVIQQIVQQPGAQPTPMAQPIQAVQQPQQVQPMQVIQQPQQAQPVQQQTASAQPVQPEQATQQQSKQGPPIIGMPDMTAVAAKSASAANKFSKLKRGTQIKAGIAVVGLVWSLLAMMICGKLAGAVCLGGFGLIFAGSVIGKKDMRTTAILLIAGIVLAVLGWKF